MYDFKRLLVCLDQSDMDKSLIKAAAEYATFGKADNIYFVTVVKSLQLPDQVKDKFPEYRTPVDEKIEADMRESISNEFQGVSCDFHFDVLEGDPTHQIIRWSQVKEIDLIILGKKQYHIGKGVVSRNIVNIVHCSALFVTANSMIEPKSVLLATDFSKASHLAYQKAVKIANIVKASLTCIHTYEIPTAFHATGSTYDEFGEIMKKYSSDEYEKFIGEEDTSVPETKADFLIDKHGNPDRIISGYASLHHFDLVVIGSKGRTALSSVLLGSVAAKMVESDMDIPILVIKTKEDNLKLVEAILQF
ncbi:MAG: universal stress protein [Bacteroidota bacterium]